MFADALAKALAEDDLSHLHLLPGDTKLKKARVRAGKNALPAGAGTKTRGGPGDSRRYHGAGL